MDLDHVRAFLRSELLLLRPNERIGELVSEPTPNEIRPFLTSSKRSRPRLQTAEYALTSVFLTVDPHRRQASLGHIETEQHYTVNIFVLLDDKNFLCAEYTINFFHAPFSLYIKHLVHRKGST